MGQLAIPLMIASTVLSTGAALSAGKAKSNEALYQSQVAQNNQTISLQNRQQALLTGNVEEQQAKLATGKKVGETLAEQGASGVDVGFGSPLAVREAIQGVGDLDAATIRYNSARRALDFANEASGYSSQSSMYKSAAKNAKTTGYLNAGASFLAGASSVSKAALAKTTGGS